MDERITRRRVVREAKWLQRLALRGIRVPAVMFVDTRLYRIYMEGICGEALCDVLRKPCLTACDKDTYARLIGTAVGHVHACDIVHGDLTTSNMMVEMVEVDQQQPSESPTKDGKESTNGDDEVSETNKMEKRLVLIDFGLVDMTPSPEDKAVDLYVLQRAILSSHSELDDLFELIIAAYKTVGQPEAVRSVLQRLEEVQKRGRKRLMVG